MFKRFSSTLTIAFSDFFHPSDRSVYPWVAWVWIVILYALGLALWGVFFQWGKFSLTFHDWAAVTAPRLLFLKDAIAHGILPLHISDISALGNITDRYLSIPDVFLSPQAFLLGFLSIGGFVLVNQALLFTAGFLGLLWFQRRFKLSPFAFTVLFLLFNFNGHVLSHFAVGHDTWGGYYLFPWFAMLVLTLLDGDRSWKWVAKVAVLLFVMLLQGSFHQFVWCLIFLGFLALASWKNVLPIASAALFSVLLSLFRLLPPSLLVSQFGKAYPFMGGYPTVGDLWKAMTAIHLPGTWTYPPFVSLILGSWEFDLYVGLLGVGFLLIFGVYFWWKNRAEPGRYNALVLPMLAITILSMGDIYQIVRLAHIPLLDGERVSTRMISLPFTFLLLLAAGEFQAWLSRVKLTPAIYAGQFALLFLGGADLWRNFTAWKIANAQKSYIFAPVFQVQWFAVDRPDPDYTRTILIGAAGSAFTLLVLIALMVMESRGTRLGRPAWLPSFRRQPTLPIPVTGETRSRSVSTRPTPVSDELESMDGEPMEAAAYRRKERT